MNDVQHAYLHTSSFFKGNQRNFIKSMSTLSIQEVYKRTQNRKAKKNKKKHPQRPNDNINPKTPQQKPAHKP
jgi:hypothetical protein